MLGSKGKLLLLCLGRLVKFREKVVGEDSCELCQVTDPVGAHAYDMGTYML